LAAAFPGCLLAFLSFALASPATGAQLQFLQPSQAPPAAQQNSASASQGANTSSPAPARAADQSIPLTQIADRAEETDRLLQEIESQMMPKEQLLSALQKAQGETDEIYKRTHQTTELLAGSSSSVELEDEQRYWSLRNLEYTTQRTHWTSIAARLEDQIQTLETQQAEWSATWDQVYKHPGIETVLNRIKQVLNSILATRGHAQEQLNLVLTLQNQISQQDQQIAGTLQRVRMARERDRRRLLEADSRPLWEAGSAGELNQVQVPALHRSFERSLGTSGEYLRTNNSTVFVVLASYLLALLGAYKLRHYVARAARPETPPEALHILDKPFAVALLVALIGTGEFVASAPIGIAFFFYLLYLIPVLRLLAPMIQPRLRTLLYVLSAFYVAEGLYLLVQLSPWVKRGLYALIVAAALAAFGWFGRPSQLHPLLFAGTKRLILLIAIRAGLALLAASLLANIFGYFALAQILGMTGLIGPFVACALYCGARVLTLVLTTVLHTAWLQNLSELRLDAIERWGARFLGFGAALLWVRVMLELMDIYESVKTGISKALQYPIGFEKLHFTLGGAFSLLLILVLGYVFANAFTLILRKVVLAKLPLQRGMSYAISRVTYYLLLFVIALAALSASGVELNKFTVLTGALGVGLGFGLQNIVNNFVSGLILLFERPIHVGDTVEVGGLVGNVRRIGARSSTVVTYQGAEVIVPNSNLLSNQVINWTLSAPWRRVDVPVGVAHGTDPELVIKLLVQAAEAHPRVMLARPPAAFFLGFGDNALNFELRFWSEDPDTWFQLRSEVTLAVEKALREAGVKIPFPQRDLHLRSIETSAAESMTNSATRLTSPSGVAQRSVRG
jgi:potassium-dependent mechanosensitive channel